MITTLKRQVNKPKMHLKPLLSTVAFIVIVNTPVLSQSSFNCYYPFIKVNISGDLLDFLFDLNAVNSVLVKQGTPYRQNPEIGYNSSHGDYQVLNQPFILRFDDIHGHKSIVAGSFAKAELFDEIQKIQKPFSFGLVDKILTEDPTTVCEYEKSHVGRIGYDGFEKARMSNFTKVWLCDQRPIFFWFVSCKKE